MRVRFSTGGAELHRDFHSTPDLAQNLLSSAAIGTINYRAPKGHHSQEDVAALLLSGGVVTGRPPLPPPTHPPPPPPVGQLVRTISQWGSCLSNFLDIVEPKDNR
jgi:SH3/ankyrin repeat-containing protein